MNAQSALIARLEQEIALKIATRIISEKRSTMLWDLLGGGLATVGPDQWRAYLTLLHAECAIAHPGRLLDLHKKWRML